MIQHVVRTADSMESTGEEETVPAWEYKSFIQEWSGIKDDNPIIAEGREWTKNQDSQKCSGFFSAELIIGERRNL